MEAKIIEKKVIVINPVPIKDIEKGLWVKFLSETETSTDEAYSDIKAFQAEYDMPKDERKVLAVWVKE